MMWKAKYGDFEEKYQAMKKWHYWFAIYPVRLGAYGKPNKILVWLRTVERRTSMASADRVIVDGGEYFLWNWEYRLPEYEGS